MYIMEEIFYFDSCHLQVSLGIYESRFKETMTPILHNKNLSASVMSGSKNKTMSHNRETDI